MKIEYPFRPKTNSYLLPGQFWAIPLSSGKYACGRVIELMPKGEIGSRTSFLAGLIDWVGENPPLADDLIGCKTIKQGSVHIKTSHRPIELEEIKSDYFRSQEAFEGCILMKGYKNLRSISKEEWERYETFSTWGYKVINILAEERFGNE